MPDAAPNEPDGLDPYRLAAGAPADLQRAADALRAANHECERLIHQLELWKALATDREMLARLGPSEVAQAVLTARDALLTAIVLGIGRMVDESRPGALNVFPSFNAVLRHASWLRDDRKGHFAALPVMLCGDRQRSDAEAADLERMIQQGSAQRAVAGFDAQLEAFRAAKKRFTSGDAGAALKRLRELRHKEMAHNDLEAVWATERPKVRDLDLALHALRDLLYSATLLCTGCHVDALHDRQRAKRAALCFGAVLRRETAEERAAASEGAEGGPG